MRRNFSKVSYSLALVLVVVVPAVFACIAVVGGRLPAQQAAPVVRPSPQNAGDQPPFPPPPTSITPALATVPPNFAGIPAQTNFDLYSWLTFVALNWPADPLTCGPDLDKSILNGTGPVVWEKYLSDSDVFVAPGSQPMSWCYASDPAQVRTKVSRLPEKVRALSERTGVTRFLHMNSKTSRAVAQKFPIIDEAVGGVLTDQNGRFVRYEIHLNEDEYKYVLGSNLWSKAGQGTFTGKVNFPAGPTVTYGPVGAMEVKAAWKVLGKGDVPTHFYTIQAIVYNDDTGDPSPGPNPVTLGLVGLHITHKTVSQTNWIWSTFEQVENTTTSFYNPNCPAAQCPPNTQTAKKPYTELGPNGQPLNAPVQVTRVTPIESSAPPLNQTFQNLLKGSVWANYQLVGTQWAGEAGPNPKPQTLANVTLETYIQPSSSCMGCHSAATLAAGNTPADFSFLLGEAQ
jgi:hypothetical protein